MSSYLDMSLDDIIKMKRKETRAKRSKVRPQRFKSVPKMAPIMDARYKIISKNRTRITDARERITQLAKQRDAPFKLDQFRQERATVSGPVRNTFPNRSVFTRAPPATEFVFADSSRQVTSQPLATATSKIDLKRQIRTQTFNAARSIEKPRLFVFADSSRQVTSQPLATATSKIDLKRQIRTQTFNAARSIEKPRLFAFRSDLQMIDDAPMEEEYIPQPLAMINRKPSEHVRIIVAANHRTVVAKKKTPQIPPQLIPIPNKLHMATLRGAIIAQKTEKPRMEYRVIVSNLSHTVTEADIKGLFGNVGPMLQSKLMCPGIAEVIYQTQNDAQAAADLYHNKHLNGQPMNCLVIAPTAPSRTDRCSFRNKTELCRTHVNVELDLATLHKVLFRK